MTLPSEEVRALQYARDFIRDCATQPRMPMKELRDRAFRCLRDFPLDYTIARKWADQVCIHGRDRQWCRQCEDAPE